MIRIKRTNQNEICMQAYPKNRFSLPFCSSHAVIGACAARACLAESRCDSWHQMVGFNYVEWLRRFSPWAQPSTLHCTCYTYWMSESTQSLHVSLLKPTPINSLGLKTFVVEPYVCFMHHACYHVNGQL